MHVVKVERLVYKIVAGEIAHAVIHIQHVSEHQIAGQRHENQNIFDIAIRIGLPHLLAALRHPFGIFDHGKKMGAHVVQIVRILAVERIKIAQISGMRATVAVAKAHNCIVNAVAPVDIGRLTQLSGGVVGVMADEILPRHRFFTAEYFVEKRHNRPLHQGKTVAEVFSGCLKAA